MKKPNRHSLFPFLLLLLTVAVLAAGCRKKDKDSAVFPVVTTDSVSWIGLHSAVAFGTVVNDGGTGIEVRGVCWGKAPNPSLADSVLSLGPAPGQFNCSLAGLEPGVTYYVRAYATNSVGTGYGASLSFTTRAIQLPVVVTNPVTEIKLVTATGGGTILDDGGSPVSAKGICYSTSPGPTIADPKTVGGAGNPYTGSITGLIGGTTYFVRAYATTSAGTGYGNEVTFSTVHDTVIDIDGNVYHVIQIGSQLWMKENLNVSRLRTGAPLFEWYCYWVPYTTHACYHNNPPFGGSYNRFSAINASLAPTGWHVPTDADWEALFVYLGGPDVAAGKLKESGTAHWNDPNTGADNSSGFNALPGGYVIAWCDGSIGGFTLHNAGMEGNFWSSGGTAVHLSYNTAQITTGYYVSWAGFSVRCIKD